MWGSALQLNAALFFVLPWMSAEFLSGLSPLETLRRYLNDRARRRQLEKREPLEQQRLQLENMERANQVALGRLEIIRQARSLGISDQSVADTMGALDSLTHREPALPAVETDGPTPTLEGDEGNA
jgi:hypothetical protein